MSFHVIWEKQAEEQLTRLWLDATDRGEITRCADEIEVVLATQGFAAGESRFGTARILIHLPLACYFHFRPEDRSVLVSKLWYCRGR